MGIYILKSTAILSLFWIIYVLFIERENIHHFKRFYLLTSIISAISIPLFSITKHVNFFPGDLMTSNLRLTSSVMEVNTVSIEPSFWTLDNVLLLIYSLGVIILSLRFFNNLFNITKTISKNEKQKESSITYVLLKNLIDPHTFFNYIFLNKLKFEKKAVPKEVLLHEATHAKQRHSLDILFMELMQIVFWFQPFIWLYKNRIKLNHEFLADQAVLQQGIETVAYQNILLKYSSDQNCSLTNAINYSSIKKRFTIMKTQTSKIKKWTLSLLVFPIFGLLFYSFSNRTIVEIQQQNSAVLITKDKRTILNQLNTSNTTQKQHKIPTSQEVSEYNTWAKKFKQKLDKAKQNKGSYAYPIIKLKELNLYKSIYDRMTSVQKKNAEQFPNLPPPPPPPNPAASSHQKGKVTANKMKIYNDWINGLKNQEGTYNQIKKTDYEYYISIYNNMSEAQKKRSTGLPPPPPEPPVPSSPKKGKN